MLRLVLLGVLAGLDNLQVAAAISMAPLTRTRRLLFALAFSVCEIGTPLIGLLLITSVRSRAGAWFDRAAPLILLLCGVTIVWLALRDNDAAPITSSRWTVVGLPLSLSMDNLLIGVGLGTFGVPPALAALTIGATSASLCLFGMFAGARIGRWIPKQAELVSGLYLIAIAATMWIRH
jgi:putative Mn2+ efflux pump MntP